MKHRKRSEEPDTTATLEVEKQKKEDKHIGCLSVIALMISLTALLIGAAQLTQVSYNSGYVKGYEEAVEAVESVLTRGGDTT